MIFNQKVVQLTGRRIALTPPVNFTATPGNEQVSLTWEDPGDATSGGVVVAEWEFTQIVRKVGSPPVNQTDGTIVTISDVKNQYLSEPFVDTGLTNGTTYYYGAFACSKAGAWSDGAFAGAIPVASVALGSLAEGTLVKIKENGTPVEFYVGKQGYEPTLNGQNRTLMVRKDIYEVMKWNQGLISNYSISDIDAWFNGTYKSVFSDTVQQLIGTTTFVYHYYSNGWVKDNLNRSVFTLSVTELGRNVDNNELIEGTALPIASVLQIANYNGSPGVQWTRTPYTPNSFISYLGNNGAAGSNYCYSVYGARPVFTLPTNALVDPDLNLIESSDIPPIETPLGDLVEGALITINESGTPVEFYVAKQDYESGLNGAGRVLMVRKDIHSNQIWDSGNVNAYAQSDITVWLNSIYKSTLSTAVQTMISTTTFPYTPGNGNSSLSSFTASVFLLSLYELGRTTSYVNNEGSQLPISSYLQNLSQWTRSPYYNSTISVAFLAANGNIFGDNPNYSEGARPVFTLPSTALVDGNLALIEEV